MQIKGTSIKATRDFVEKNFPDKFDFWLDSLPPESRRMFSEPPLLTQWYPFIAGLKIPTEVIARLFFDDDIEQASYLLGKHSADVALTGVYRIFIKITDPRFILKKFPTIYSTYYDFGKAELLQLEKSFGKYIIYSLPKEAELLVPRIKGWTEQTLLTIKKRALEITTKNQYTSETTFDAYFFVKWD